MNISRSLFTRLYDKTLKSILDWINDHDNKIVFTISYIAVSLVLSVAISLFWFFQPEYILLITAGISNNLFTASPDQFRGAKFPPSDLSFGANRTKLPCLSSAPAKLAPLNHSFL
jgi:hypothetical protein